MDLKLFGMLPLNKLFYSFLFLTVLLLVSKAGYGQVIDTTRQKQQLETGPPAGPTKPPVNRPAPIVRPTPPPDTVKKGMPVKPKDEETYVKKPSLIDKLFVGGGGELGFSSDNYFGNLFNIGASPILGYRLFKNFAVGPGLIVRYLSANGIHFTDYGGKVFAQYTIAHSFLAHAEQEILNSEQPRFDARGDYIGKYRTSIQSTFVGGGYRQMANDRFGFDVYVLFNVGTNSAFSGSQPVIRGGIIYNLK